MLRRVCAVRQGGWVAMSRSRVLKEIERVAGIERRVAFRWGGLAARAGVVTVVIAASWLLSWLGFWVATDRGQIYEESLGYGEQLNGVLGGMTKKVEIEGAAEYSMEWTPERGIFVIAVSVDGVPAVEIYGGRLDALVVMACEELKAFEGEEKMAFRYDYGGMSPKLEVPELSIMGYGLKWVYIGEAGRGVRDLYGEGATQGCRIVTSYSRPPWWAPLARDAVVHVPKGGIAPLMGMLLERVGEGYDRLGSLDGGGLGERGASPPGRLDAMMAHALTERIANDVTAGFDLDGLEESLERISLALGPIQFLTITMSLVSLMLLIVSLWSWWARSSVEIAMNLIPYIGFFGTLLGMGQALSVLGDANLSDPVSKATNLGPIGSRLALAIQTTKWALVCYCGVSLMVLVRDSVFRRRDERGEGTGGG